MKSMVTTVDDIVLDNWMFLRAELKKKSQKIILTNCTLSIQILEEKNQNLSVNLNI